MISQSKQDAARGSLHHELAARMACVLSACGGRLVMLSGHRPPGEQAALYDKGRKVVWSRDWRPISELITDRSKIVTNARPMSSAHNYSPSRAVDCVLDDVRVKVSKRDGRSDLWCTTTPEARDAWADYGSACKAEGLMWGGDWRMRALPHAELPDFRDARWL